MDLDEVEFRDHLKAITSQQWQQLFDILMQIENKTTFGGVVIPKEKNQIPYIESDEIVDHFHAIVGKKLKIIFDYDWMKWKKGIEIVNNPNFDYSTLDLFNLCKILTIIIRNQRYHEGFLKSKLEDNTIQKIIEAIQQIIILKN